MNKEKKKWQVSDNLQASQIDEQNTIILDVNSGEFYSTGDIGGKIIQNLESCLLKKYQPSLISQELAPAIRPSGEIGFLIDCHCQLREADRIIPEWLLKNKITYRNFIKMDKSKALNTSLIDSIIFFKAGIYNLSKSLLFIENSQTQALRIARLTKKDVLCWKTREMIQIN